MKPELRPILSEHLETLLQFLLKFPGESRDARFWRLRFELWWSLNPSFSPATPMGWGLFEGNEIVGFLGNVPTRYQIQGTEFIVANSTTWRVEPKARKESLALLYAAGTAGETTMLFNTTPNQDVAKILRSLRFAEAPSVIGGATSKLFCKGERWWLRLAGNVLNLKYSREGTAARQIHFSDAQDRKQLDDLWSRTSKRFPTTFVRDASQLQWFCSGPADFEKILLGSFQKEKLSGIALLGIRSYARKKVMHLLDLWTEADSKIALPELIRGAKNLADSYRCDLLELPHFTPDLRETLTALGVWMSSPNDRRHFFYGNRAPSPEDKFFFTYLEGDLSL